MFNKKGQGALEYLLLIGGAVLVAVIVITLLLQITETGSGSTEETTASSLCTNKAALQDVVCSDITDVKIGTVEYDCDGAYPNCIATKA